VYDPKRKGVANLMTLYGLLTGQSAKQIEKAFEGKGYGDFKKDLAEHLSKRLEPLQEKINAYIKNEKALIDILEDGAKKARAQAQQKMGVVRKTIGVKI
jgi:tryptophanyl-tRNA synthetase